MIFRQRIVRDSDAQIEARRRRQRAIAAARAANRMAKSAAAIERRAGADEPQAPQREVSQILRRFMREYEALTESEQIAFEAIVKRYVVGRVSVTNGPASPGRSERTIWQACRLSRRSASGW